MERSARRLKCNAVVLELPNRPFLRRRARFSVYLGVVLKRILTDNFFVTNQINIKKDMKFFTYNIP